MNNIQFYNSVNLYRFSHSKLHYVDNISNGGTKTNFFGWLITGSAEFCFNGKSEKLSIGELVFIPKNFRYESLWQPDETGKVEWYSLSFDMLPDEKFYPLQIIIPNKTDIDILSKIKYADNKSKLIGLTYILFGNLLWNMNYSHNEPGKELLTVIRTMEEYPELNNTELADKCSMSVSKLYQLFSAESDLSPNEQRQKILCDKADLLLANTDMPIEQISERLGFSSSSYFRKIYAKFHNITPYTYRKRNYHGI